MNGPLDKELLTPIGIWGDTKVQQKLDGPVRNKTVFVKIPFKMVEAGLLEVVQGQAEESEVGKESGKDHKGFQGKGARSGAFLNS